MTSETVKKRNKRKKECRTNEGTKGRKNKREERKQNRNKLTNHTNGKTNENPIYSASVVVSLFKASQTCGFNIGNFKSMFEHETTLNYMQ